MGNEMELSLAWQSHTTPGTNSTGPVVGKRVWSMMSRCCQEVRCLNPMCLVLHSASLYHLNIFFLCPQSSTLPTFLWPALPAKVSSPSKAHAMPHLGRAFTDVQECKQVLGSAIKKYVLNDKPPKRYSKNLFLWINATPGKTVQGWDSIVRWQQG